MLKFSVRELNTMCPNNVPLRLRVGVDHTSRAFMLSPLLLTVLTRPLGKGRVSSSLRHAGKKKIKGAVSRPV